MSRGDMISVPCVWGILPYRHYGIDLGDGTVIHLATVPDSPTMQVQRISWDSFADGKPVRVESVRSGFGSEEVVQRAMQAVGLTGYHLALGNCEHFARYCKTGESISHQADRVIGSVLRTGLVGAVACSTKAVAAMAASGVPRGLMSRASGVSGLIGEVARQSAYAASRSCSIEHHRADRIGKTAGTIAAGIVGSAAGGPVGGLSSVALYLSIDQMTQRAWDRWIAGPKSVAGPKPYRKSNGSVSSDGEY
jgi:hypothetical protein